jgi:hypothetical protein
MKDYKWQNKINLQIMKIVINKTFYKIRNKQNNNLY